MPCGGVEAGGMVIPSGPTSCTGVNSRLPPVLDLPDVVDRRCEMIFLFQLSPKWGMNHIVADFRQIMWRKFLRNLSKYSTMAQKVLPHNLA